MKWFWKKDDSNIPACVNCKHMNKEHQLCGKLTWRKNPVTGISQNMLCSAARDEESGACGRNGKYFEPKSE